MYVFLLPPSLNSSNLRTTTDEVAAIVGDIGADTCKFGYGGEDSPKHVFASTAGYLAPATSVHVRTTKYIEKHPRIRAWMNEKKSIGHFVR